MRRGVLLIALVALSAGCGGAQTATPTTTVGHMHRACKLQVAVLEVTVIDGATLRRVPGAHVRLLRSKAVTNKHGQAEFRGPERRLEVGVSARHYTPVRVPVNFRRRKQTIRIYQPRLQWPLYGATPQRTQAQTNIRLRPPFHPAW